MSYLALLKDEISEKQLPSELTKPTEGLLSVLSVPTVGTFADKGGNLEATIQAACKGLNITPDQFMALLNDQDKAAILGGEIRVVPTLRAYAKSFAEGIQSGRIRFHPTSGALLEHL